MFKIIGLSCLSLLFLACQADSSARKSEVKAARTDHFEPLEDVDPCLAKRVPLYLNQPVTLDLSVFTDAKVPVGDSLKMDQDMEDILTIQNIELSNPMLTFNVWKTFSPGEDVLILDEHRQTLCMLSDAEVNGTDFKTVFIGKRSAIETGFLSEEKVYQSLKSCFARAPEKRGLLSISRSPLVHSVLSVRLNAELKRYLPEFETEDYKKQFYLRFSESDTSPIPMVIESKNRNHYLWVPSFQEGCDHGINKENPYFAYGSP